MYAADLVNTLPLSTPPATDTLETLAQLQAFLAAHPYSGRLVIDEDELQQVRMARTRIRAFWEHSRDNAVPLVNDLLREARAVPRLVKHDGFDWHIHATPDDAPLATRMLVETAMAMSDVIRANEYSRLRICAADDCSAVYVDYSKNRSKRYCDTGNCGNRMHVNAYRERQREIP